jgi:tetratricopeptide (TPR) repeat protein
MKKLILASVLGLMALSATAQVDKVMMEQKKKDKEKNDKAITEEKSKVKASTWLERGKLYDEIARMYTDIDSTASMVAFDAFKKAAELDVKDGKPGKIAKEAQGYLGGGNENGVNLHGALVKQGAEKFQMKKYEDALKLLSLAQEVLPKDTLAPLYGAYSAMQAQKNDIGAQQMEKYINNGGKDPGNYSLLAQLYRMDKKNDKALELLDRGVTALPANKTAFKSERVNVLLDMGKTEDAINGLNELTTLDPKNPQYAVNMGILQDNAASQYTTDIRKMTDVAKKVSTMERHLKDAEETDKVFNDEIKRLSDLIKKQPKSPDLKRQLADAQTKLKENKAVVEESKSELAKAKAEAATLGDPTAKIVELTTKQNERRQLAVAAYNKALAIDPANYDALFNLGVYYFNEAVEMKKVVDGMDMKDYQAKGKEVEAKVCGKFKQAQPYFLKAKAVKEEEILLENLKNLDSVLKQFEEKKVVCEEVK